MDFSFYTNKDISEVLQGLEVGPRVGLFDQEISARREKYGSNLLEIQKTGWWLIFARQLKSSFVYLLFFAAGVALFLREYIDAILIGAFVLINSVLGFFQEYRSERTLELLKKYVVPKAQVHRNGKQSNVPAQDLVVGDIILAETGDIIPADIRVIESHELLVDESVLTGESLQVSKLAGALPKEETEPYKAINIGFSQTLVVSGRVEGVVIAVGKDTQFGKIAGLTYSSSRASGFEKEINKFSRFTLYLVFCTLGLVFLAHLLFKPSSVSPVELLIFSIALAVGVIPEALPVVITFSLSRGALLLAKMHVVVKRLSAIEDLGGIEILCSDKTGTLTQNNLVVADIISDDPEKLLFYAALAAENIFSKEKLPNNAFDLALVKKMAERDLLETLNYTRIAELPFDPTRRRNSVLVGKEEKETLVVRGAYESVEPFLKSNTADFADWIVKNGKEGKRVLAVAKKEVDFKGDYAKDFEESALELCGLISFVDPIKETAKDAVLKAQNLGVKINILTGDSVEVAGAVAFEVGIIDSPQKVITGEALDKMDVSERHSAVESNSVFARVSPQQKYELIKLLQEKHEVGYLGEGINDAPALKIAGVALAVQGAADIAVSAADIVLLSQDLHVIINGIEEGRKTFVNTFKYIKSTLASNFGNFYAVALSSLMIPFLPMLPIQILLLNLLSDFPMISIATDNVSPAELRRPEKYDVKETIISATLLGLISTVFDFMFFGFFYKSGVGILQTAWFIGSVFTELSLLYSIRTRLPFFKAATAPSKPIIVLTLIAFLLTISLPFTSLGHELFKFVNLSLNQLALVFTITLFYFLTTELAKNLFWRFTKRRAYV